ncbi:MAG: fatty acid desaturase [Chloroflexi bacterium]|nr:fatty acid desaturase [Chloroflexota bacterium]MCI0578457.1 fatty acid desaturase [Chloroflexota bacterium]MCI0643903.1 fatty acid desaturase [Chloroflexota bacterium]MCI0729187.1 fatty acid desaturase [Chloroflexota bacterium]
MNTTNTLARPGKPAWTSIVAKYQTPDQWKSNRQLANSFLPFIFLWYLTYRSLAYSYWLALVLALLSAGFLMRIFIIQHDCGHGSFFKTRRANDTVGFICGIFTLTPYFQWRRRHAIHHATSSNLDERGVGDVPTMTVEEYLQAPYWRRIAYRLFRHPLILFTLVPAAVFFVINRFPAPGSPKRERASVYWTDLALATVLLAAHLTIGLKAFFLVAVPIMWLAASVGTWLFFVQHQFEDTYWDEARHWDFTLAGLQGSSYYKLPRLLQWFTGNIGFHHIHHLSPRIPNYSLQKCHEENPLFQQVVVLTLAASLKTMTLSLWDEKQRKLVRFRDLKPIRAVR